MHLKICFSYKFSSGFLLRRRWQHRILKHDKHRERPQSVSCMLFSLMPVILETLV